MVFNDHIAFSYLISFSHTKCLCCCLVFFLVVEVGFSQAVYTVSEGEGEVRFMIIKSGSNARDVGVTIATDQNSATSKKNCLSNQ